jgi:hypothetical protein
MIADDVRRPYPHPYQVNARRERPAQAPGRIPRPAPDPARAEAAERTVHRLHHIRLVSDQAISVIDQVLERAS